MTLVLELPDRNEAALKARAEARGVSTEAYAALILDRELENPSKDGAGETDDDRPISEAIAEIMADVPPEVLAQLPKDGASQHDHYIYGWPKRDV
jgi:plasmid stability protein